MKNTIVKIWMVCAVWWISGCGNTLDRPVNETVKGGELVVDIDAGSLKAILLEGETAGVDQNTTVYGYRAYKIPYTTTDEEGNRVKVSGLMTVPTGVPELIRTVGYSAVSDDHGTIFANSEAPTVTAKQTNAPAGSSVILTSLFAFVTLQPDYIGFGDSKEHYHPFVLKKSLANATVDFIRAAKQFAAQNNIPLNGQLFLTGYSEGGYAAMAALEKIENDGDLEVTLAAPMAGPYILDGMASQVLRSERLSVPSFMADIAYAYTIAYGEDIASVINAPFAAKLKRLFDGSKRREEIDPELTRTTTGPNGLFKPSFVEGFFAGNWFTVAASQNNLYKWAPQTPVRLLHCIGDDVIPFAISTNTAQSLLGFGAKDVGVIPVEVAITRDPATQVRFGHAQCASFAYGVAASIFADIRKNTIGY